MVTNCDHLRKLKFSQAQPFGVTDHGAHKVRVFGSVARGTVRRGSDVDFLVEMEEGCSLLDNAALILDLERLLKRPVDVASERGLHQSLRKEVLRDEIAL